MVFYPKWRIWTRNIGKRIPEREEKKTERKRGEKLILVVCQAEERQNLCVEIHYSQLQCKLVGWKHFILFFFIIEFTNNILFILSVCPLLFLYGMTGDDSTSIPRRTTIENH